MAGCLIPLDKCPGVSGVGEVPRRIITKAVLKIVGPDIEEAAGPLQVCAGQDGGCKTAVHAMRQIFKPPNLKEFYLWMLPVHSIPLTLYQPMTANAVMTFVNSP